MSDKEPPSSITERILADPQELLTPDQRQAALADAKEMGAALKGVLEDRPVHVGDEHAGRLAPPDNPLLDKAAGMKPSTSLTEAILADPHAFLAPDQRMANALGAAKEVAAAARAWVQGEPVHVGNEQAGQLRPRDTPSFGR